MDRREFLQTAGAAASITTAFMPSVVLATEQAGPEPKTPLIIVDIDSVTTDKAPEDDVTVHAWGFDDANRYCNVTGGDMVREPLSSGQRHMYIPASYWMACISISSKDAEVVFISATHPVEDIQIINDNRSGCINPSNFSLIGRDDDLEPGDLAGRDVVYFGNNSEARDAVVASCDKFGATPTIIGGSVMELAAKFDAYQSELPRLVPKSPVLETGSPTAAV